MLEGVSHRGELRPGLLVLPPPPVEGSGMDHVVGAELAYAVSRLGHPTLRFNYRGVGGSQGQPSKQPADWLEDAVAALELARDNTGGADVVVASIGASDAVVLKLAERERLAGIALVNPSILTPGDLTGVSLPLGVVLAELDPLHDRAAWAEVLQSLDGVLSVVAGATRTYQRGLPEVGKAVASLVGRAGFASRRNL